MALHRFSYRSLQVIGACGLALSSACIILIAGALATGNYDHNVASLMPTTVLGIAVFFGMWAVRKQRDAEIDVIEDDL